MFFNKILFLDGYDLLKDFLLFCKVFMIFLKLLQEGFEYQNFL